MIIIFTPRQSISNKSYMQKIIIEKMTKDYIKSKEARKKESQISFISFDEYNNINKKGL